MDRGTLVSQPLGGLFARPCMPMIAAIVAIGTIRLATLGALELTDNTEARYGEISRRMYESGDWITPRLYIDGELVPFLGKPPLFFWLAAASYQVFGVSEWAARLPNFLLGGLLVLSTVLFGKRIWGAPTGALAGLVLASSGIVFVLSATCLLDVALAVSITWAMMCFALFAREEQHRTAWGRLFFASLALGCLAKGPLAIVLVGLAIGGWLIATRQLKLIARLPWLTGLLVWAAITCPWYGLAERATPGFLRYFIINEHFLRYVRHDYGDLYGQGRTQPYGASWLMLAIDFLPWTPFLVLMAIERWKKRSQTSTPPRDPWVLYACIWGLTPAIFFTLCRQILVTYLLPGLPGLALATAVIVTRWLESGQPLRLMPLLRSQAAVLGVLMTLGFAGGAVLHASALALLPLFAGCAVFAVMSWRGHRDGSPSTLLVAAGLGTSLVIAVATVAAAPWIDESFSARTILDVVAQQPELNGRPVTFSHGEEYSAEYYRAVTKGDEIERHCDKGCPFLLRAIAESRSDVIIMRAKEWQRLDDDMRLGLEALAATPHWVAIQVRTVSPAIATGEPARLH